MKYLVTYINTMNGQIESDQMEGRPYAGANQVEDWSIKLNMNITGIFLIWKILSWSPIYKEKTNE